jgi:hypothetical protein
MIVAGRFDDGSAERATLQMAGTLEAAIRRARSAASAPFLRLGWLLLHAGWLIGPSGEPLEAARRLEGGADPQVRQKVVASLEGELRDLVDDATGRGISDRAADALLVTVDILAWLRDGGEPPGWAATELLEVRVALFNDALHDDEREMRRAFLDVLVLLLGEQVAALRDSRLRQRRINIESAEQSESRRFAANLEMLRVSRDLTVGELAAGAGLDLVTVVGLLRGARSVSSAEILVLADALQVDPGTLLPERPCVANPALLGGRGLR